MNSLRRLSRVLYSGRILPFTNCLTGGLFFTFGDLMVQKCLEKRNWIEVDKKRIFTSAISGLYMGGVGHYWYTFLDRRFPGNSFSMIRTKLLAELAVGPPFAASIFLVVGLLEQKPMSKIIADIKKNVHYLLLCDWFFYIPMQYFNFYYLPPKYRVLFVAFISIIYDSALVYIIRKDDIKES